MIRNERVACLGKRKKRRPKSERLVPYQPWNSPVFNKLRTFNRPSLVRFTVLHELLNTSAVIGGRILVFRCLVWVIAKLTHVWDVQIELTGSMVGYSSEVDEVFKSPSHSFC